MKIHDITRPLGPRTVPWPGDTPYSLSWTLRMEDGESVNLCTVRMSPHVGTHTDAPLHVRPGAASAEAAHLIAYLGPARVLTAVLDGEGRIAPASLDGVDVAVAPRLLFRTGTDPDPYTWPGTFASFAPETCRLAADRGAVLVGIDTPSVDPVDSKSLPAHQTLLDAGLHWIENLDLSAVVPGRYELCALPLPMIGACASPVRAVLIER